MLSLMGVLSRNITNWEKINIPPHIKRYIKEGVYIPFSSTPTECEFDNYKLNKEEESFVSAKLKDYLKNGYISKVDHRLEKN